VRLIDLSKVHTYPLRQRPNLVKLSDLLDPTEPAQAFDCPDLEEVAKRLIAARRNGRPVIWMMGAHVIKSGLSRLVIDMMHRGIITHVAGNGAVSIHDFELGLIGETSEDVAHSLEDGSFGMAEETGAFMHKAIRSGARDGLGYGAAIGRFIYENPQLFPHRDINVLYNAYILGVPATIHATIGTDIIDQHPSVDFGAIGVTSGRDFRLFARSVSRLEGGVFLNLGSAVTGPEVFLKSLTIVRNLGYTVEKITTANFDLIPLGPDYRSAVSTSDPIYYYRPRKNIVNRPTSLGGKGYHITGDHRVTIPNLHHRVVAELGEMPLQQDLAAPTQSDAYGVLEALATRQPVLKRPLSDGSTDLFEHMEHAFQALTQCFRAGGTLFICGNGGSMADALHISGELLKSYARPRPLSDHVRTRLSAQPDGELLVHNLEGGLRAVVLGSNPSLASAVANDMPDRDVNLAQELLALARPGDILLGISTSGNAANVSYAAQTAHALGMTVIGLTGNTGGRLTSLSDIPLRVPADRTDRVQELHIQCYHALREMIEDEFFSENRERYRN